MFELQEAVREINSMLTNFNIKKLTLSMLGFSFFHPIPETKETMVQPRAPAEGYPIALLPITATHPPRTVNTNLSSSLYFCEKINHFN